MNPQFLDAVEATIKVCTAMTLIVSIINIILTIINHAREPEVKQDERLTDLEERMTRAEEKLASDKKEFERYEEGNKIVMQSLLALMRHSIDGNHVDNLKEAAKHLDDYLVNK